MRDYLIAMFSALILLSLGTNCHEWLLNTSGPDWIAALAWTASAYIASAAIAIGLLHDLAVTMWRRFKR